ncbi:MAG: UDP-N-acetylglucosamine--N-acetylmuramyl-(pentapeptide) pyrophosphoryl-undecaprenol N-acetylglucosamine transferase [Candidatus Margulisbacteria bacterium]|jgi:UDP-N-acetylglucosamine--N-acetylmuramyl-(pentapeptide) pyrophosphoryl-undecaprenol N-acetylglucosamine transferase|nr:UDP-N-acetylglucosamine--N-acetylmuramyl-(pentapeptide) pyrophosphoryl-undecaprenol N-acetylglucosamine transferase [Candidatus Margulisiibacteriota bacterium]
MKICFSCGGTGGHIYPALAIAEKFTDCFFIGSRRLEKTLAPQAGHRFYEIPASSKDPRAVMAGFYQALKILAREKPDLVIATGGYVTVPVILAAKLLGKKVYLQEQNILPGRVNRYLSHLAAKVFIAFAGAAKYFPRNKAVLTGNPVRKDILNVGFSPNNTKILVFGGSLSAKSLNIATNALKTSEALLNTIVHLDGTNYQHNMADLYSNAKLCVCRAGATTLSELAAVGLPSILIPYPQAADNHQEFNARYFTERGAAVLLLDKDLTADSLAAAIARIDNPETLTRMSNAAKTLHFKNAAEKIKDFIVGQYTRRFEKLDG